MPHASWHHSVRLHMWVAGADKCPHDLDTGCPTCSSQGVHKTMIGGLFCCVRCRWMALAKPRGTAGSQRSCPWTRVAAALPTTRCGAAGRPASQVRPCRQQHRRWPAAAPLLCASRVVRQSPSWWLRMLPRGFPREAGADTRVSHPSSASATHPAGNGLGESLRKHAAALRRCLALHLRLLAAAGEVATLDAAAVLLGSPGGPCADAMPDVAGCVGLAGSELGVFEVFDHSSGAKHSDT